MKGLIIEGVSSSGKTSILRYLHNTLTREKPANTKLFLSEHYSERMLEHVKEMGLLSEDLVIKHCLNILEFLEMLEKMKYESKFACREGNVTVIATIERFLLTHIANMVEKTPDAWGEYWISTIKEVYSRLNSLGFIQVILTLPKEELKTRLLNTLEHRNPAWNEHVLGFGRAEDIVERYWKWQCVVQKYGLITQMVIPQIVVDVSEQNYESIAARLWKELRLD